MRCVESQCLPYSSRQKSPAVASWRFPLHNRQKPPAGCFCTGQAFHKPDNWRIWRACRPSGLPFLGIIMIYALLKALLLKPRLLINHLRNYAELVGCETQAAVRHWTIKAVAWIVFGICMLLFLIMAGSAVMLGVLHGQYHWILLVVPAVPLALACIALIVGLQKSESAPVASIKQQFVADMQALAAPPAAKDHEH